MNICEMMVMMHCLWSDRSHLENRLYFTFSAFESVLSLNASLHNVCESTVNVFILQLWAGYCVCVCKRTHAVILIKIFHKNGIECHISFMSETFSLLFFRCESLLLRLHLDRRNHYSSLPRQVEGDAFLIVSTFIDEERIKRFVAFVCQCFPWERLEQRVFRVKQAEVSVLLGRRML